MKRALTVVLFRLFTIGVCVDGNEDSVSVTEGDSVTLKSGVTEIQTDDKIEWRFNGIRIAKISSESNEIWVKPDGSFKDRLQLDRQTGDLKISNISTTDSGEYKVKISSIRVSPPEMIFSVKVVSAVVKSVFGLEGYPVTLHTDPTYIQGDDVIQWRFGQQKSLVAEMNRDAGIFNTSDGPDGRFRDRLKLDHQSGSLIIIDTRITDSGLYEVEISSSRSRHTIHHTQSISLTVRALPDPGLSPGAAAGIGVVVLLLAAAAAGVIYYFCRHKITELKRPKEKGQKHKNQDTEDPANEETKLNDP